MLLNEITKAGALVDICDRCLGMWLDRGEMEKIASRLREVEREWDDDRPPRGLRRDMPHVDDYGPHPKKKRWTELFDIFD